MLIKCSRCLPDARCVRLSRRAKRTGTSNAKPSPAASGQPPPGTACRLSHARRLTLRQWRKKHGLHLPPVAERIFSGPTARRPTHPRCLLWAE